MLEMTQEARGRKEGAEEGLEEGLEAGRKREKGSEEARGRRGEHFNEVGS